ncbi:MAG: adenosylmethionine decarboxylase [Bacteroidetes bacterium]|nr:adenosylmethionine decarboxylase [Bacteroidia bacterium]PCH69699.1 MAG: adenosylmethionine decarboxylase [Bacteroidota bacterium]
MEALGLHVLMEFHKCPFEILNNLKALELTMNDAAKASKATIIKSVFHQFSPQGVTGVIVVAESHIAIHTWPEHGYAAVDFFTCNMDMDYKKAYYLLVHNLKSKVYTYRSIKRGNLQYKDVGYELSKN